MKHYWILTFSTLAFVPWASAEEVELMKTPSSNWDWDPFGVTIQHATGVSMICINLKYSNLFHLIEENKASSFDF